MAAGILWAVVVGVLTIGLIAALACCAEEWSEGDLTGMGSRLLILFLVLFCIVFFVPFLTI